jgi:hypothetical protein
MKSALPTDVHGQAMFMDMTANQLLTAVNQLCKERTVTRPTLVRWRKDWGFDHGPYSIDHARTFAHYGDLLTLGFPPEQAHQMTINHFEAQAS